MPIIELLITQNLQLQISLKLLPILTHLDFHKLLITPVETLLGVSTTFIWFSVTPAIHLLNQVSDKRSLRKTGISLQQSFGIAKAPGRIRRKAILQRLRS
jgi:hypothetical protein